MKKLLFAFVAAISINTTLQAETLVFQATSDFADTDSGEVPYYLHNRESALAINASVEEFRDKFARATTSYSGDGGLYDVTVSALGEIDGECEFRFLVNGVVVASAVNDRVDEDYGIQNHLFEDINIPANAEIAVESNAVSNGLVPEDDIFAFARGRWTTLTLESDETATAATVDLALSTEINNYTPTVGQSINIEFEIFNESTSVTATNPALQITLPDQLTIDQQSQCNVSGTTVNCMLAEIAPKAQSSFTITAKASQNGTGQISSAISADQQDNITSNNTSSTEVSVTAAAPVQASPTVDLAVAATSDITTANVGDTINYTLTVINQHQSNVATAPTIGVLLPGGMSFSTSSDCTAIGRSVQCDLQELTSDQSATVGFTAKTNVPGTATLIVSVSASEAEDSTDDNEVLYSISVADTSTTVVDTDRSNSITNTGGTTNTGTSSGGGSMTSIALLQLSMLAMAMLRRRSVTTA